MSDIYGLIPKSVCSIPSGMTTPKIVKGAYRKFKIQNVFPIDTK